MPKFNVYGHVTGSKYLGEYEADTPEQAEEMAMEAAGHLNLCHHCAGECEYGQIEECTVELIKDPKEKKAPKAKGKGKRRK